MGSWVASDNVYNMTTNRIDPRIQVINRLATFIEGQPFTPAEHAYITDHVIEAARTRKTSIAKLSQKVIETIIEEAKADANDSDIEIEPEPGTYTMMSDDEIDANIAADAKLQDDMRNGECPRVEVPGLGRSVPRPTVRERRSDDMPAVTHKHLKLVREAAAEAVETAPKNARRSHANCDHEATKVARAICRREAAKKS